MDMNDSARPFVSIIMPIRNEQRYIGKSLRSVLGQDYPAQKMEILIVDGMSTDGTLDAVRAVLDQAKAPSRNAPGDVVVLSNPSRIVPCALNIGLARARGKVIIRVDGHCEIAPDYVRQCIEVLNSSAADCVGGAIRTVGETRLAEAIALAQSSFFGAGNAAFRRGLRRGIYVDTVAFGAYRRGLFDRIGAFDEELVRNQDDEFNFRLIQNGGKIWMDPSIQSIYYSRSDLHSLWRQYFQYGFYKIRVMQKRKTVLSSRHLIPALFLFAAISGLILALLFCNIVFAIIVLGPYIIMNIAATVVLAREKRSSLIYLPVIFPVLHFAYGLGTLAGIWRWRKHFLPT